MDLKFDIPPRPGILLKLEEEISKLEPDLNRLEAIISQDIGVSAAVMKLANSPRFGGSRKFSSIQGAILYLGLDTVLSLVTVSALKAALSGKQPHLDSFWNKGLEQAEKMAELVEQDYKFLGISKSTAYTYGLFQDCGIAMLLLNFTDYQDQYTKYTAIDCSDFSWEESLYGVSHSQLGYMLAESWGMPAPVTLAIRHHHEVDKYEIAMDGLPEHTLKLMCLSKICTKLLNHCCEASELLDAKVLGLLKQFEEKANKISI